MLVIRAGRYTFWDLDYQRFYFPDLGQSLRADWTFGAYGGIGLRGELKSTDPDQEGYSLRLPAGVQFEVEKIPLQFFADVAGMLGPFPKTELHFGARGGVRFFF